MTVSIPDLIAVNQQRFDVVKLQRASAFAAVAKRLVAAKDRYVALEQKTGVPWYIIAVIHEREASQNFACSLAQGDPWNAISVHKPAGRGPFRSFEEAAIDALVNCAPYAARWKNWTAGGALTLLLLYNGEGYEDFHHMASPYIWAGTDQYLKGKYVADGQFDADAVDQQLGCAGMVIAIQAIDPSVLPIPSAPVPAPTPQPVSIFTTILNAILALFKGK